MHYSVHFWKKAPFVKIVLAFAAGILGQWYVHPPVSFWIISGIAAAMLLAIFSLVYIPSRYRFRQIPGLLAMLALLSAGALVAWKKDIRNNHRWLGHRYEKDDAVVVVLEEPPVEKTKSYKADARVIAIVQEGKTIPAHGHLICYFQKDTSQNESTAASLSYGSKLIFRKPLQEISNAGNPGGFDYKRYSLFRGFTHQVFLKQTEYVRLPGSSTNRVKKIIFSIREKIISILQTHIPGHKESGLAEALLIGYKDDLEQSLVQSYTNTGVIHIIAISGLHLGLIYWLLVQLLKPLLRSRKTRWLRPVLILCGLWAFCFLAGAQPSVLRSAVMFSFIVLGESFSRKSSIFNSMAASAFLLLYINPYWLWDVGFQLSYAAVASILVFMRPVYNWFYFSKKLPDFIWKLNSVTIAAQVFTLPISMYHFHQFPVLFIITNFLAVPLSSAILLTEILLCGISFIPFIATMTGKVLYGGIWFMNTWVESVERIPGSLWDGLYVSLIQALLLLLFTASFSYWLMEKNKRALHWSLMLFLCFAALRSFSFVQRTNQQKIVVYNVPQKTAIDFISGRNFLFVGDSDLLQEGFARNFHLKPSRILHRVARTEDLNGFFADGPYIQFLNKRLLLTGETISFVPVAAKQAVDVLVVTKNPKLYFSRLATALQIRQVVFDGSCPAWKVKYWKKDCDSLKIPWHDVRTQGAFVMNLR